MKFLPKPIIYLDATDFDDSGNLTNPVLLSEGLPIFIMIQANFCHHCEIAKPEYYQFAIQNKNKVICATIQGDSDLPQVQAIKPKIASIYPNFYGFPSYLLYKDGKKIIYKDGRSTDDLQDFLDGILDA